ncbi:MULTISPECIES: DUF2935 domain-containing protein [unclassified Clostridium]|uniref:DUF2935 domain-containing protein n=1 Tax=unclassified Clostridium TaxID=2614128 RepID=UPI0002986C76|nr:MULTISPECIES: DUF2935 domain-containing protein [unclassified Clostridium]EKQ56768.1 MAG: Protein of unknown function (DUF2935) [Clostridium sp. Maddingley MBC34-26]
MAYNSINQIALFEHNFWLQILGDHSRFILNALSPKETYFVKEANEFINLFDSMLDKARKLISEEKLHELNYKSYSAAIKIKEFKLIILSKQIKGKIYINLPPTFLNHMINELDEYIYILTELIKGNIPTSKDIHMHLLWLPDGSGHAATLTSTLDMTHKELIKKAKEYSKVFDNLYLKAIEYKGYMRTGICEFPALRKLNFDAEEIMNCFKKFLKELEAGILEKEILGTLYPLMTDHMFREECYYLTKLSMVSDIETPKCDPAKPRIEM